MSFDVKDKKVDVYLHQIKQKQIMLKFRTPDLPPSNPTKTRLFANWIENIFVFRSTFRK